MAQTRQYMIDELGRLATFALWQSKNVYPSLLAKAGFFYTGTGDILECHSCHIQLGNWQRPWIDALAEHIKGNPRCPFLQQHLLPSAQLPQPRPATDANQLTEDSEIPVGQHHELQQTLRQLIEEGDISDDTKEKLLEEVEKRECKVCLQNFSSILFLPCRHLSCCRSCATYMQTCPVCREIIRLAIPVHFGTGNLPVPVELINMSIP